MAPPPSSPCGGIHPGIGPKYRAQGHVYASLLALTHVIRQVVRLVIRHRISHVIRHVIMDVVRQENNPDTLRATL